LNKQKRKMRIAKIILPLIILAAGTSFLPAQTTLNRVIENGELRVGMTGDQPPLTIKVADGQYIGYDVDMASALAEGMGVKLVIVEKPFNALLEALESGEIDAIISGMAITPERSVRALFAGPYTLSGKSVLTKSNILARARNARDINDSRFRISVLKGSNAQKYVDRLLPDVTVLPVDNYDIGVEMVRNGDVDALLADYEICIMNAMKYASEGLVTLDEPLNIEPVGIALPPDDIHFHNLIDNYLVSLQMNGTLEMLERLWFGDDSWMNQLKK
jgi:polar amino acid transport system substrate-binding protein